MVIHTCNPRLHAQQLIYIINHAEQKAMVFDATFAPLIKGIAAHCPTVKTWICLADAANTPAIDGVANVVSFEELLAPCSDVFAWPEFDENAGAALCYTSGTTGNPKGVLYSHRAIVLQSMAGGMPNILSVSCRDTILPVVPMFHINAWCIPYGAPIAGAKLVLPGNKLDGESLHTLMEDEKVTISAGVPSIWQGLIAYVDQHKLRFSTMRRTGVGGSAMPQALIARFVDDYQVEVRHGWGMTETTAVATMGTLMPQDLDLPPEQQHAIVARQGKSLFGVEIKVIDEKGVTVPRDGSSQGELMVRGPWILRDYFKGERSPLQDGWFPTGDIATIDAKGIMQIRDRTKDVIKTGGEWISSIDLESAAVAHPAVAMAAVIGVKHPKWDERPLMFIVRKPGQAVEKDTLIAFLSERVAKWWLPDDIIFVDSLPVGGTGKVQKEELRKKYGGVFS
jgi:acyl-CoA synthetase (AMP-forming)/AMP-acid ligase II